MPSWEIRRANLDDASALADCIDSAYAMYSSRIADLPEVSGRIAEDIESNLVWIAAADAKIVGGVVIVLKDDYAVLANVAVHPKMAGAGLGRALIERAETESHRHGKTALRLTTHVGMPENVRLYEHLGWRMIGKSGNKVHMEKAIKD